MFEGFTLSMIDAKGVTIRVRHGGRGPGLLLLHGNPQTHVMWHKIAPRLAQDFTVVAADLRGYGGSAKPPTTPDHAPYSKRAMALDQIEVMRQLGFERFCVAGHDRGGRCAYRMALDHPGKIEKLAVLDIIPTGEAFRRADMAFGMGYWHWFFMAQPAPVPERLMAAKPDYFLLRRSQPDGALPPYFTPDAYADYRRCFTEATIHAICEDYRAAASIDFMHDEADRGLRKIASPLLALWGKHAQLEQWYDVLAVWREWADDVRGQSIACGHYLPEEAPDETCRALLQFFTSSSG